MDSLTLYRKHSGGAIGCWLIVLVRGPDGEPCTLKYGHSVTTDGSISWFADPIVLNSSGRGYEEQGRLEFESRVNRMRQRGYKDTPEAAASAVGLNQHGHVMPMLAHPIQRVGPPRPGVRLWEQPKFDGHRALTAYDEGGHVIYSRKGTDITRVGSVDHIMSTIQQVLPSDIALDGELYVHGVPLQDIGSWVKLKQQNSLRLEYIVYDVVMPEPYSVRFEVLKDVVGLLNARNSQIDGASTREIASIGEGYEASFRWRRLGYEGGIVRVDGTPYKPGVRSSSLLKLKERLESEFKILRVVPVKIGANLVLQATNGREFETLAPGDHAQKAKFLVDEALWKNRYATCEYPYLTTDGIPFHCICTRIREDV